MIDRWGEFLYRVTIETAQRWCAQGIVTEVAWNETRAVMPHAEHEEHVKSMRPRFGERYTHDHETDDNPRGVWTFRKKSYEQPPA